MSRVSISQLTTMRWSFHQDVVRYQLHGINSIGIWRPKVEEHDLLDVIDYLHEMRMEVSSVHWAGGFTGGNGISYADAVQDGMDAIEIASRLEAGCLIVHPGCRNGHTTTHARRLLHSALRTLVPLAADYGVRLAIELMPCPNANNWTFMQRVNGTLDLINEFPEEHLGVIVDLYHVGLNDEVFDSLEQFANRIALVQLADRSDEDHSSERRLALGSGNVLFEQWFNQLSQIGYTGTFEVELHGEGMSNLSYDDRLSSIAEFIQAAPALQRSSANAESMVIRRPFKRNS